MLDFWLLSGKISETVYRKICRENAEKLFGLGRIAI
jgi:predicted TIM-barrel fold metal-dependent hydrolase